MHDGKVETTYKDSSFENFSDMGTKKEIYPRRQDSQGWDVWGIEKS